MPNTEIITKASSLYSIVFPGSNFYKLSMQSPSYKGFIELAKQIMKDTENGK